MGQKETGIPFVKKEGAPQETLDLQKLYEGHKESFDTKAQETLYGSQKRNLEALAPEEMQDIYAGIMESDREMLVGISIGEPGADHSMMDIRAITTDADNDEDLRKYFSELLCDRFATYYAYGATVGNKALMERLLAVTREEFEDLVNSVMMSFS